MLTPAQREDLATFASAWGVPDGTACYALAARELARFRNSAGELGEVAAAIRSGLRCLAAGDAGAAEFSSGSGLASALLKSGPPPKKRSVSAELA